MSSPPKDGPAYADGQYSARWDSTASLPYCIGVTVTLDGGLITDVVASPHATNPTSLDLQNRSGKPCRRSSSHAGWVTGRVG